MAELVENKVIVSEKRKRDQLITKGFGEKEGKDLVLDLKEAIYLIGKEKLEITKGKAAVTEKKLFEIGEKADPKFYSKYLVFRDLREKGYVVKTGYKFGFDLRVYPRGKKPGEEHSQYVLNVSTQDELFSMPEISRMVRLSANLNTTFVQAIVDSENDVNYYPITRLLP
ncbi:MAG: tRNA-intron lyase [Candidatus Diapherotrites archaeon]|nr:tRNA-intron lyase [Candidatus Diapherotrites archaeon]